MAKKIKEDLYKEARELYIYTDLSLADISKQLNIKVNTLYTMSTREKWALLKTDKIKEVVNAKNTMINDRKLKSIEFYEKVMDLCSFLIGGDLTSRDIKEYVATYNLAEDRFLLLASSPLEIKKEEKENNTGGILEELSEL